MSKSNTAVLWTGGKDCALAFYKAQKLGYTISYLVTFVPKNPNFRAHPLAIIDKQVDVIQLPHIKVLVEEPMKESYENGIQKLIDNYGVQTLITGDIDEIENHSNWIEECSKKSGMKVFNPLWKKNREELLKELLSSNFNTIFTLTKKPYFGPNWTGKQINNQTLNQLRAMDIDLCGENGEYHTMVLDAPFFQHKINISSFEEQETEQYYFLKYS